MPSIISTKDTLEVSPLTEPGNVDGTLADIGANWLFVRWLADHFSTDSRLTWGRG